jgi:hypothetical protein
MSLHSKSVYYVLELFEADAWQWYGLYQPDQKELLIKDCNQLRNDGTKVRIMYHTVEEVTWGL